MTKRYRGAFAFGLGAVGICLLWLFVLPRVGSIEGVRTRIEGNRAAGINPTAVFYTDHPAMADIERRISAKVNANSGKFWKIGE